MDHSPKNCKIRNGGFVERSLSYHLAVCLRISSKHYVLQGFENCFF